MPSAVLRSTYARVRGSLRIRTMAIVNNALLADRLQPLYQQLAQKATVEV
jgi:hypothetical protein